MVATKEEAMKTLKLFVAVAVVALGASPVQAQKTLKYAHFQPAKDDQPKHVAALAFKEHLEKATGGSVKVEIYPAGQFGKDQPTMEGLKLGTLELAVAHDGAIATVHKPIGVLGIPFLYDNHEHAWRVYDSPWLQEFSSDMVKKTGIRMLGLADNGVRHFTNSVRPIRSPADMKGMKIRIQPSPVFKALVESLGASASAIPWAELPTALQQKVVDGQENGVTNILAASLYQHQKYVTLDGHVWSIHAYMVNERFFQGLSATEKKAVEEGTKKAVAIHRKMTSEQDRNAKQILEKVGMQVTVLSPAEVQRFRKLAQPPVQQWAEKEIGKPYVDSLFKAVASTRKK
jgi:C4-dicarboxylate-binding protein DctP